MSAEFADYKAVAATVQAYLDAGKAGSADDMAKAFHKDATMYGHFKQHLLAGPAQNLFDWVAKNGPAPGLTAQIADVTVSGTAAAARVEIDDWQGVRYTDLFVLVKIDGRWQIITKAFDAHRDA